MSVAEASEDMTCLLEEVRTCKFVLEELKEKLDSTTTGQEWLITVQLLNKPEGPFKLLEDAFLTFKANYDAAKSKQNTVLKTWTKIKAPFYRPQVEKLLQILRSQIQLLHVALTNDSVRLGEDIYKTQQENSMVLTDLQKMVRGQAETSSNQLLEVQERLAEIHTVVRNTKDSQETERKRAILDWLTPCQYAAQQSDFVNRRTPATGQWLLSSEEFKQWSENEGQTLFCPGDPGAGKTILTSMVVEYLTTTFHQRETASVAHIYCDFRQRQEQKLVDLLASLLKQLCQIQAEAWLPDVVIELYNRHISKMSRPTATELSEALDHVSGDMSRTSRVFIIIDALDECHYNGGPLAPLLRILFDLQAHHRISIFATSRRIPDIERYFKDQPTEPICADRNDIEKYLNDCLRGYRGDLPSFVHNDEELQHDIKTSILDAAGGR
jgi:hypothetical protein